MLKHQMLPNLEELKSVNALPPPTNEQYLAAAEEIYGNLFNGNFDKHMDFNDYLKIMMKNQMVKPISEFANSIRQKKLMSYERKGSVYKKVLSPNTHKFKKEIKNLQIKQTSLEKMKAPTQRLYENRGKKLLLNGITAEDEFY